MKHFCCLLLATLAIICPAYSQNVMNDLKGLGLSTTAKTLTVKVYKAKDNFGEVNKGKQIAYYRVSLNDKGQISESQHFNEDGTLNQRTMFKFGSNGNEQQQLVYLADADVVYMRYEYKYDQAGYLTEETRYATNGEQLWRCLYRYDEQGKVIEELSYTEENDQEPTKTIVKYTPEGYEAERITVDVKQGEQEREVYQYDERGNLIAMESYLEEYNTGKLIFGSKNFYEYVFDEKQNWTQQITYRGESRIPEAITERVIEY